MRLIDVFAPTCLVVSLLLIPNKAAAAPITGSFFLDGTVSGMTGGLSFYKNTPGDHTGTIALPTTGSFSDLTAGDTQTILDATVANGVVPGTNFDFKNWVQLTNGINLDLMSIPIPSLSACPTSGTVAVGFSCLVNAKSPVVLTQGANGVGAVVATFGMAHTGNQTNDVEFRGLFVSPSTNFETIADFENFFNTNGNIPPIGYTANFTIIPATTVPEPRWLTVGFGALLACIGLRRKSQARKS
ncbi:MAG TPA: hypothetical protein VH351_07420 [Bryobacteraceae bacterium]|nr:hypothetical protein [Bryobacteraceae bacterium]